MTKIRLYLAMAAFLTLIFAASALAQDVPRVATTVNAAMWSDFKETYRDANGNAVAEYDYRLAPLTGNLHARLTESLAFVGHISYSRLYSIDNPPTWAFSPDSIGQMWEVEGAIAFYLTEGAFVRGGVSVLDMTRTLNVYSAGRYNGIDIRTMYTSPFVGAGIAFDDTIIVGLSADYFPVIKVHDSYNQFAEGGGTSNNGARIQGAIGAHITERFALVGTANWQRFATRDGSDGADGSRRLRGRTFGAELRVGF